MVMSCLSEAMRVERTYDACLSADTFITCTLGLTGSTIAVDLTLTTSGVHQQSTSPPLSNPLISHCVLTSAPLSLATPAGSTSTRPPTLPSPPPPRSSSPTSTHSSRPLSAKPNFRRDTAFCAIARDAPTPSSRMCGQRRSGRSRGMSVSGREGRSAGKWR